MSLPRPLQSADVGVETVCGTLRLQHRLSEHKNSPTLLQFRAEMSRAGRHCHSAAALVPSVWEVEVFFSDGSTELLLDSIYSLLSDIISHCPSNMSDILGYWGLLDGLGLRACLKTVCSIGVCFFLLWKDTQDSYGWLSGEWCHLPSLGVYTWNFRA